MDFWLVAAVAGAGYLSKYWQNINLSRKSRLAQLLSTEDSDPKKTESQGCPLRALTNRLKPRSKDHISSFNDDLDELYLLNLQSGLLDNGESESLNSLPWSVSTKELDSGIKTGTRNRSAVSTTKLASHGLSLKPMNSLESCLLAQLHRESSETQEYILSQSRRESFSAQIGDEGRKSFGENVESAFGVPLLRPNGSMNLSKNGKDKTRSELNGKETTAKGREHSDETGKFLICLGISIGLVSSFIITKREVDKLKGLLKQSEGLVQDLHEELEMKDSMTVKELANDNPQDINTDGSGSRVQRADESSECISKIEAELEAELERLGLNMSSSTLETQSCNVTEIDLDMSVDFAQGELRVDRIRLEDSSNSKSNDGASSSATHETANYVVSPRELSLRLHEVIQSRLEERVNELEVALQNSQRKVKLMQSGGKNWAEPRYLQAQESPVSKEPLEELMRMSDSEEEDSPRRIYEDIHCSAQSLHGRSIEIPEEKLLGEDILVIGSNDTESTRDEISDSEDEVERELIKQIVERTKKGSEFVINAQRLLFSMQETNETFK